MVSCRGISALSKHVREAAVQTEETAAPETTLQEESQPAPDFESREETESTAPVSQDAVIPPASEDSAATGDTTAVSDRTQEAADTDAEDGHEHVWIPAVSVVHHDAVTHTVHHDAVTHTIHHDAVTHTVHHDAVTHTEPVPPVFVGYQEVVVGQKFIGYGYDIMYCSECGMPLSENQYLVEHICPDSYFNYGECYEKDGVRYCTRCNLEMTNFNGESHNVSVMLHVCPNGLVIEDDFTNCQYDIAEAGEWVPDIETEEVCEYFEDRTVVDQEAYDEVIVDKEAYDEVILCHEAYDEVIIDQAPYDELVTGYKCSVCGIVK